MRLMCSAAAVLAAFSLLFTACNDKGPPPDRPAHDANVGACPERAVLEASCTCGEAVFTPADTPTVCQDGALVPKALPPPERSFVLAEVCNGIDDDLDDVVDEDGACAAACNPAAVAETVAALVLPQADDHTVSVDQAGEVQPELTAFSAVPEGCLGAAPQSDSAIVVGCGEVLDVDSAGLSVRSLTVLPGGVVRLVAAATLELTEDLVVCPGAVIQAGGASSRDHDGEDGHALRISARRILQLGTITTTGGASGGLLAPGRVGDAGALTIDAERWLFAGLIDTSGRDHLDGYGAPLAGGRPGSIQVHVSLESFISGLIRARNSRGGTQLGCGAGGDGGGGGEIALDVPVCCHVDEPFDIGGGEGGNGGAGEDDWEGEPYALTGDVRDDTVLGSLCDGEDVVSFAAAGGEVVAMSVALDPGEDVDLELFVDDELVAVSEGVGTEEQVVVPGAGRVRARVVAVGPVSAPGGPYRLRVER